MVVGGKTSGIEKSVGGEITVVNYSSVSDSLKLHDSIGRGCCPKLLRMFWFLVVWYMWLMRNEVIFLEKLPSYVHLIDIIKTRS
ncbi:hypothetical protein Lal_00028036 [Lupinus albus]|nr:hypothetical protein Lal_00028036 [Lupinus albus]